MNPIRLRQGQAVLFDGDSGTALRRWPCLDTWPFLRLSGNDRSWADHFAEHLFAWRPDLNLSFHNAAVGGAICRDVIGRFDTMVRPHRPDWVFMTLGGNDAHRKIPLAEYRRHLRDYASRLAEWDGHLVLLVGFRTLPGASPARAQSQAARSRYYRAGRAIAKAIPNVHALDVGQGLMRKAVTLHRQHPLHVCLGDGTHLNNLGALILAGEVLRAVGLVDADAP